MRGGILSVVWAGGSKRGHAGGPGAESCVKDVEEESLVCQPRGREVKVSEQVAWVVWGSKGGRAATLEVPRLRCR